MELSMIQNWILTNLDDNLMIILDSDVDEIVLLITVLSHFQLILMDFDHFGVKSNKKLNKRLKKNCWNTSKMAKFNQKLSNLTGCLIFFYHFWALLIKKEIFLNFDLFWSVFELIDWNQTCLNQFCRYDLDFNDESGLKKVD